MEYLHQEKLHDLYFSQNIIRVIKSRMKIWAGHVARTGKKRGAYRVFGGETGGKEPSLKTKARKGG